jgi:uncharacterized protein (DUF2062 family)
MSIRIAILTLSGAGGETARLSPCARTSPCPPDAVVLKGAATSPPNLTAAQLVAAAREAETHGATHLAVLPRWTPSLRKGLRQLVAACRSQPDAVIVGRRPTPAEAGLYRRWHERVWPRFWLKMQTGRHLKDPTSPLRLYPLAVIDHLRLYQRGQPLATEILVKSAWAGVAFAEVALKVDTVSLPEIAVPLWQRVWQVLLNIHFALRSVLPIPHRKLVAAGGRPGRRISVWRPMRSLHQLLSENTSPIQLALAAAMGVFLGTLPLIAFHSVAIILAANYFRLNKVAALSVSQLCMPPVVPALCIETGYWLRHGRFLTEMSLETLGYQALERLYEWLLGALVLAPLLALLMGGLTLVMARLAARRVVRVRPLKPTADNGLES